MTIVMKFSGGRLVDWVTQLANGRKALVLREEQVSQTIGGRHWARTVQTKAQWPGQQLFKVQNESHALTFQVYDGVRYHCAVREDTSLLVAVAARRSLDVGAAADGNVSVVYLGFATVEGVYCRGYDVTVRSAEIETRLRVYEDHARRRLFMLQVANLRWRFDVLTPIVSEADNPLSASDMDIEAILDTCDPPDRVQPPPLTEGSLSAIILPQPEWGALSNTSTRSGPEMKQNANETIVMSQEDSPAWLSLNATSSGRRAINAYSCVSNGGIYNVFTLPPDARFRSVADLMAGNTGSKQLFDPPVFFVWESCNDEIAAYLSGSGGNGCPSFSGGIGLSISGLATGRPIIRGGGKIRLSINLCSCPPLMLPDIIVPFCPKVEIIISAYLDDAMSESRTCQIGSFPRGNVRLTGNLRTTIGWGVSATFSVSAHMYLGFRCASQQPRGSKLKIGHRYEVCALFTSGFFEHASPPHILACYLLEFYSLPALQSE
jgi:hypothetical protein